ncbi:MAG: hypothetical protein A2031_05835 [Deltaproteobacteria bacterium RBG_19FT_COMBO_43_11]|nr:MAG: hypothetical protein A2W27_00740 [Deltaproteobacteria bacterium RBG_16_44_11]OGP91104.1 MAG: hypothetical protein A2031_05835 [Deltaproteobacteria bacterium RBG_19FT_COMBO_43_11]
MAKRDCAGEWIIFFTPLYLNLAVNKYDVLWLTLFQFYINFTPELLKVNPNIANVFNEFWLMLMLGMKV